VKYSQSYSAYASPSNRYFRWAQESPVEDALCS
jgi:hypothetical protein